MLITVAACNKLHVEIAFLSQFYLSGMLFVLHCILISLFNPCHKWSAVLSIVKSVAYMKVQRAQWFLWTPRITAAVVKWQQSVLLAPLEKGFILYSLGAPILHGFHRTASQTTQTGLGQSQTLQLFPIAFYEIPLTPSLFIHPPSLLSAYLRSACSKVSQCKSTFYPGLL